MSAFRYLGAAVLFFFSVLSCPIYVEFFRFVLVDVNVCCACRWVYAHAYIYVLCVAQAKLCQVTYVRDTRGPLKRIDALSPTILAAVMSFSTAYLCMMLPSRAKIRPKRPTSDEFSVRKPRFRGFVSKRVKSFASTLPEDSCPNIVEQILRASPQDTLPQRCILDAVSKQVRRNSPRNSPNWLRLELKTTAF